MTRRAIRHMVYGAGVVASAVAVAACSETPDAPAHCPEFCPQAQFGLVDTVLPAGIERDSSFTGYINPIDAPVLLAEDVPGVIDSRPIFRTGAIAPGLPPLSTDTTTAPIHVDSIRMSITLQFRDAGAHNLTLHFFRLPLTIDTNTTFADVAPDFAAPEIRSFNLDSLLAQSGQKDTIRGDSVVSTNDTLGEVVVSLRFDTLELPYVAADSGKVALGIRVSADSAAHIAVGAADGGLGTVITWYNSVDSAGVLVSRTAQRRLAVFDTYVFDPPPAPLDSNLTIGGMPSSRALLRVSLPRWLRDSTQIIRATLYLVPVTPVTGFQADSFFLTAGRLAADLGRKSPLAIDTAVFNSAPIHPGNADTVRLELTGMLRVWQVDTAAQMAMYIRQMIVTGQVFTGRLNGTEGATFTAMRFYSTATGPLKPTLHLTYVPRIRFSIP